MSGVYKTAFYREETSQMQLEIYRLMSGEQKLHASYELYQFAVMLMKSSILESSPDITPEALKKELIRRFYG